MSDEPSIPQTMLCYQTQLPPQDQDPRFLSIRVDSRNPSGLRLPRQTLCFYFADSTGVFVDGVLQVTNLSPVYLIPDNYVSATGKSVPEGSATASFLWLAGNQLLLLGVKEPSLSGEESASEVSAST